MEKIALFAFNGDPTCFVHVLLNALDLEAGGREVALVIEGAATALVPELAGGKHPLSGLYRQVKEQGLIHAVCRACSAKLKVLEAVQREGLPLAGDMKGHPGMGRYLSEGYSIITF